MRAVTMGIADRMRNTAAMEDRSEKYPTKTGDRAAIPMRTVNTKPSVSSRRLEGIISIKKISDNPDWPAPNVPSKTIQMYITHDDVTLVNPRIERPQRINPPTRTGFRLPIQ